MTVASMTVLASPPGATWGLVSCPKTNMDRVRSNCQPRGYRMTLISSNEAIVDLLMIKCSIGLLILLKTCNQRFCFSCNETFSPSPHETGIWGFEAAFAIFSRMIAEWWHHALTKVTPQVLKSSTCVFSFPLVFLLSRHLHSSSAFILPVCSSAPFRSSSPAFFISCQMISETGLIPRPAPSSFPRVDLSVSLCSWLSAFFIFSRSRIFMLIWLPFSSLCLSLLFLFSCHLTRLSHLFFVCSHLYISI